MLKPIILATVYALLGLGTTDHSGLTPVLSRGLVPQNKTLTQGTCPAREQLPRDPKEMQVAQAFKPLETRTELNWIQRGTLTSLQWPTLSMSGQLPCDPELMQAIRGLQFVPAGMLETCPAPYSSHAGATVVLDENSTRPAPEQCLRGSQSDPKQMQVGRWFGDNRSTSLSMFLMRLEEEAYKNRIRKAQQHRRKQHREGEYRNATLPPMPLMLSKNNIRQAPRYPDKGPFTCTIDGHCEQN